ncbi:uncharacterized protein [Drosophila pseudoobscura]|uniref:Uncharacterized protein n=1 Tax=Drosophila pseudoobscura pseudoobscura TaxID=46245 RepID=A0A6I8V101_DROPS|nr:uncharacterized protein LOC6900804 [Drosophila pseudoobscura]
MKSEALHKLLAFCALLIACAWSQPLTPPEHQPRTIDRQLLLIENNVSAEDAQNYHIAIPRKAKAGEPCLTITWKTNPDGSGPDYPRIYMADGYFRILPPSIPSISSMSRDQPQ